MQATQQNTSYRELLETLHQDCACLSNAHGRLVAGNRKFCKLFGFSEEEVEWHYLVDIYRNAADWQVVRNHVELYGELRNFCVRLRNRRGRSFFCKLERIPVSMPDGSLLYLTTMLKLATVRSNDKDLLDVRRLRELASQGNHGLVYLVTCHSCQKVRDTHGAWIPLPHGSARNSVSRRLPEYCPQCAARLYPEMQEELPALAL